MSRKIAAIVSFREDVREQTSTLQGQRSGIGARDVRRPDRDQLAQVEAIDNSGIPELNLHGRASAKHCSRLLKQSFDEIMYHHRPSIILDDHPDGSLCSLRHLADIDLIVEVDYSSSHLYAPGTRY